MASATEDIARKYRLTVSDYCRMGEAGILHEDSRVELIEGEIIDMPPIGSIHAGTVSYLTRQFGLAVGESAIVSPQNPVILGEHSEPQPDIALLRPCDDFYTKSHPHPEDVLLIAEVSDSTLRYDHGIKIPLYARHGIPEVWLVDVEHEKLSLFRKPAEGHYQDVISSAPLAVTTPDRMPKVTVDLSGLFWSRFQSD
jgi:Uma2 family endonuclease